MNIDDMPREFRIHGMDCPDEVAILREAISRLGVSTGNMTFDIVSGVMRISPAAKAEDVAIVKAVGSTGMRAERLGVAAPLSGG